MLTFVEVPLYVETICKYSENGIFLRFLHAFLGLGDAKKGFTPPPSLRRHCSQVMGSQSLWKFEAGAFFERFKVFFYLPSR
jgi:hypothetical protein